MTVKKKRKLVITSKEDGVSTKVNRNARIVDSNESDDDAEEQWLKEDSAIEDALEAVNFDNMEKDDLLREIQKVDKEYLRINLRLTGLHKRRRHIFKGDQDALNLQLKALKQRSDMLFKCLDKVLPDKRETKLDLHLNQTETDQIPDRILKKIIAGTISEEEMLHYQHLFEKAEAQSNTTKH